MLARAMVLCSLAGLFLELGSASLKVAPP